MLNAGQLVEGDKLPSREQVAVDAEEFLPRVAANITRQSSFIFVAQIFCLACGVLSNFMIARLLGPEGRGLIFVPQFIAAVGMTALNFGLGPAAVFYLGKRTEVQEAEVLSSIFWPTLLISSTPLIALALPWPWHVALFSSSKISAQYLLLGLAAIPLTTLALNLSYFAMAKGEILNYNLLRAASPVIFFASLCAGALAGVRAVSAIAALWVLSLLLPAIYAGFLFARTGGRWTLGSLKFLRKLFHFGWRSHLGAVTQYLQHRIDVILVTSFLPLREIGLYSLAVSVAELLWYLPHAIGPVLMPHVAGNSEQESNRITNFFCRATFMITAGLAIVMAIAAAIVIPRLLPAFVPSLRVIYLLLPGTVAASIFKVLSSDLNGRGKPLETFWPAAVALSVCLIAGIFVIPRYGITGAAVITSVGYILNSAFYLRAYSKLTGTRAWHLLFFRDAPSLWRTFRA